MKSERGLVVAGFAAISIVWGSTWLAIKVGLESIPPVFGVTLRFTLAAAVLLAVLAVRGERVRFTRDTFPVYLVLGLFSFSLPFVLVYWGEQYVGSGLAAVLFAVYPFVVAILSHLFLPGERLNAFKAAGTLLGFAGIVVIFWADVAQGSAGVRGMGAIVLSTIFQGFSLVMVKRSGKHIPPMHLTLGGMLVSVVVLWAMAFTLEDPADVRFDAAGIGSILYLGTFGSVLTFGVYYWLLKRVEALFLSLTALVTPILAVILGALFLGEALAGRVYAGSAMVLAGILAANGRDLLWRLRGGTQRIARGPEGESPARPSSADTKQPIGKQ